MLELANERRPNSRLSCQIKLTAALDGMQVHTPEGQH
jgi:2Fe-2S ferredoxin